VGTPEQARAAGTLREGNEMPELRLLRQEQPCEKQRTFMAKALGGCEPQPLEASLHQVTPLPFPQGQLYNLGPPES